MTIPYSLPAFVSISSIHVDSRQPPHFVKYLESILSRTDHHPYGYIGAYSIPIYELLPDLFRDFFNKSKLAPLLLLGQVVAFFRGGEAALRAQANPVQVDVLCRFLDPFQDVLFIFQLTEFRREQAQHDLLIVLQEAKRLEIACPLGIELQIVAGVVIDT